MFHGYIPECCQRHGSIPRVGGPREDRRDKSRSDATPRVVRMNVNLLEVCGRRLEHLHVRETDGGITCQSDPELATA